MKCPKCQTENPEGKKYCRVCEAQLIFACPRCGSELTPGDRFCSNCGQKLEEMAEKRPETPRPYVELGRRQATVLFSDLLGYTVITEKLDPEDVRDLMNQVFREIAQVVAKYEGFIDRYIGDAALAIFGIPRAHEDDAVRAIRAAMEIHDLVSNLSRKFVAKIGLPLVMHTGIDTGLVVIDESGIIEGEYTVTGDTINLASHLSSLAKSGEILVSPDAYQLSEGFFNFRDLGQTDIKGKVKPVRVYKLLSVRERPVTIHRLSGLKADLIGRNVEIGRLWEALGRLREGKGTIVSIHGDAGTGKSRLIEEFKANTSLDEVQWIEGHAYDYCQNISYFPIIDAMNRVWQIREGDSPENIREKLELAIERITGESMDVVPYIGSLYSLSYPELEGIAPELWKKCLYKAIMVILSTVVQRRPTVFFLEDLHWADPSSLELIRYVSTELKYPALFLYAYRPHFNLFTSQQVMGLGNSYQEIEIRELSPSEAQEMMGSILRSRAVPNELSRFVQEKAEGNPFYLEEVVNSLIESKTLIRDNGSWKLTRDLSEYGLSGTIQGIISARVDCLEGGVKRTLQEASVIGRAFPHRILQAAKKFEEHLDQDLNELERLDLIRIKSALPDVEYIFKHALTQEVAYNSLLLKRRKEIHRRIGKAIEELYLDRLEDFYETLAFHYKQGESYDKALDYLIKSGEKSRDRYALEESHQYFQEAYGILSNKQGRTKEEDALLIDLLINWAYVFFSRGDFKVLTDLLIANQDLAKSLGDKARLGMFYAWLGCNMFWREKLKDAYQYLSRALKLGEEIGDQQVIGYTCSWLSWTYALLGLMDKAITHGERARELYRSLNSDHYLNSVSLWGIGVAYHCKGEVKKVFEAGEALLEYGQSHNSIRNLVLGYNVMAMGHQLNGDYPSAIKNCIQGIEVSVDPSYTLTSRMILGIIYTMNGQFQEAKDTSQQVIIYSEQFGTEAFGTPSKMNLGAILIAQGRMDQGLKMMEEAQRSFLENENKYFYAVSEFMMGMIYLQMVEKAAPVKLTTMIRNIVFLIKNVPFAAKKAEDHFNKAIEVCREIGAKGMMGGDYLDLGLLYRAKGEKARARECISTAIELFEQCELENWLRQAREALASL